MGEDHGFDAPAKASPGFPGGFHQQTRLLAELRRDREGDGVVVACDRAQAPSNARQERLRAARLQSEPVARSRRRSRVGAVCQDGGAALRAASGREKRGGARALGRIAAGRPVEAISSPETISLADFANGKSGVYVLKVKGDSMVEDHICDGDFILVEGVETAENGEIVVALTGGTDATLKRFYRESNGRVRLQPANSQMEALILPGRDVKIQGRVIGVLRKY